MADRLSECQADMRILTDAADDIERTLRAVDATCSPDTWSGPAGDRFREEWAKHRSAIMAALDDARDQVQAITARVKREEEQARAAATT
ncbi:hypothetical protein GCM10010106_41280 [Thermopolyspora flexuosa]|uniref:WXG100 family type VII secretion target n=1 Tax=Thermopolyspora flexuosa TaxID=103836 RepID=A0A543IUJ2_9ACTN|nr:hypothetical protein [Thermopolyspora flexuosa]TQM74235.1 hypothetical protein FHX40_0901 [Thermopolyspora flexuosa]GGM89577.1 hypothetical protein GCM10010106_41280 [Thermopolyspora flexuosa]